MKLNFRQKLCPTCKTQIGIGLFSSRGKIIRCPKCGELLIEKSVTNLLWGLSLVLVILLLLGSHFFFGDSFLLDLLIFLAVFIVFVLNDSLTIVKKDLVIWNKQTNQISYIDHADWNEILENTKGKENIFEITERL